MRAYGPAVSIHKLFAILIGLAVFFAPVLTRAGEAVAAVPNHHLQMMESGHCKQQSDSSGSDEEGMPSCCMSVTVAVAASAAAPVTEPERRPLPADFSAPTFNVPRPREIDPPPPRTA